MEKAPGAIGASRQATSMNSLSTEAECACAQDGMSGEVQVLQQGCGLHGDADGKNYCYVVGGVACKGAAPSVAFTGAAWRLCDPQTEDRASATEAGTEDVSKADVLAAVQNALGSLEN